jgi:small subunit ribosomal protein S18
MARDNKNTDRKQSSRSNSKDKIVKAKACAFCKDGVKGIDYKDTNLLRKFISDRGKIRARRVTGNCTQHQRDIAMAVKNAREVALLPYTSTAR